MQLSNTYAADHGIDITKDLQVLVVKPGDHMLFDTFDEMNNWCAENEYSFQDQHWEGKVFVNILID
ncbi:hypothetical protein D3C75_224070 [compost metagenome]